MAKKMIIHAPLTSSVIHVDDFNIYDAFIGQQTQAVLEAEIEVDILEG